MLMADSGRDTGTGLLTTWMEAAEGERRGRRRFETLFGSVFGGGIAGCSDWNKCRALVSFQI